MASAYTVRYIDEKGTMLDFPVSDPLLVQNLRKLDQNGDRIVSKEDFANHPLAQRENVFLDSVAKGLFPHDALRQEGFRRLALLHNRAKRFAETIDQWKELHTDLRIYNLSRDLEFSAKDWPAVSAQITYGEMNRERLTNLSYEMYKVPYLLVGLKPRIALPIAPNNGCGEKSIYGYEYSEADIPSFLKDSLKKTVRNYLEGVRWLTGYEFLAVECDEWGIGSLDDCPSLSGFDFQRVRFLTKVEAADRFSYFETGACGCFPPSTYLLTRDGNAITFQELLRLQEKGLEFPELASLDPQTGATIYQRPAEIFFFNKLEANLHTLHLKTLEGEETTLQVTGEHRLRVEREGRTIWVRARDLAEGDCLMGPDGQISFYDQRKSAIAEGNFDVYTPSFAAEETGQIPTFLISQDGYNWFAAHNPK